MADPIRPAAKISCADADDVPCDTHGSAAAESECARACVVTICLRTCVRAYVRVVKNRINIRERPELAHVSPFCHKGKKNPEYAYMYETHAL